MTIQAKSIQIMGYLRICAYAILVSIVVFQAAKAFALAPHMPEVGLRHEVDHKIESAEKARDRKASDKVQKHKEHKKSKKDKNKPKEKKPPKPSKEDKKRAARDKARNLS